VYFRIINFSGASFWLPWWGRWGGGGGAGWFCTSSVGFSLST